MKTNLTLACLALLIVHAACDKKPRPAAETPADPPAEPQGRPRPDRPVDDPEPFKALAGIYVTADFFRIDSLRRDAKEAFGSTVKLPEVLTNPDGTISVPKCRAITKEQMDQWGWKHENVTSYTDITQLYAVIRGFACFDDRFRTNIMLIKPDGTVNYCYTPITLPQNEITESSLITNISSKLTRYESGLISDCESGKEHWKETYHYFYLTIENGMLVGQTYGLNNWNEFALTWYYKKIK